MDEYERAMILTLRVTTTISYSGRHCSSIRPTTSMFKHISSSKCLSVQDMPRFETVGCDKAWPTRRRRALLDMHTLCRVTIIGTTLEEKGGWRCEDAHEGCKGGCGVNHLAACPKIIPVCEAINDQSFFGGSPSPTHQSRCHPRGTRCGA